MKPVVLQFTGGYWDKRRLRTDAADQEEAFLASGCYEMSHHGKVGSKIVGLSGDAIAYARHHGWRAAQDAGLGGSHCYVVSEYRETETEIVITFRDIPVERVAQTKGGAK
jgi:hypothetical protein